MRLLLVLLGGLLFGFALALSTMTRQEQVLAFLRLDDLGLMLVMAGGMSVTALVFFLAPRARSRALDGSSWQPLKDILDRRTIVGAALFGVGWGVSGLCPGSALASLGTGNLPVLAGLGGMLIGAYLERVIFAAKRPDSTGS